MITIRLDWESLKNNIDARKESVQWFEINNEYHLYLFDDQLSFYCILDKDNDASDVSDFEANYKASGNKKISPRDSDTGGVISSPKFAPDGWKQQLREWEMQTCTPGSVHEKRPDGTDFNFTTLKFYDANEVELTQQADIDTSCVKTVCDWTPNHDISIKGGYVSQILSPAVDVYAWVQAVPDVPGVTVTFAEGGLNMAYVDAKGKVGLDGVAASVLPYTEIVSGVYANTIRFIYTHPAGFKHRVQCVLDLFVPGGV